jgi:hypothetical protein
MLGIVPPASAKLFPRAKAVWEEIGPPPTARQPVVPSPVKVESAKKEGVQSGVAEGQAKVVDQS